MEIYVSAYLAADCLRVAVQEGSRLIKHSRVPLLLSSPKRTTLHSSELYINSL